jgi:hypothetical protein
MTADEGILADDDEARAEIAAAAAKEVLDRAEAAAVEARAARERHETEMRGAEVALNEAFARGASKIDLARQSARQLTSKGELRAAVKAAEQANNDLAEAECKCEQARKNVASFALNRRRQSIDERLVSEYVRNAELIAGALASSWRLANDVTKMNEHMSRSLPVPSALISPDFLRLLDLPRLRSDPLREKLGHYWGQRNDPARLATFPLSAIVPIDSLGLHSARNSVDEWITARDRIRDNEARLVSLYETAAVSIADLLISEARVRWDAAKLEGKNPAEIYWTISVLLPRPGGGRRDGLDAIFGMKWPRQLPEVTGGGA